MEVKTLSQFKSKLQGGGARPDLFEVSIPAFPAVVSGDWSPSDDGENGTFRFLYVRTTPVSLYCWND